jgi:hypothetical protein
MFVIRQLDDPGFPLTSVVNFRFITLPLLLVMVLLLTGMGIFFFFNYRLLFLLEREDWPALGYYLEQKIYINGKYNVRNTRLLASSYLVTSDYPSVLKLESKANLVKPSVVQKNILLFGSARILSGNHTEAAMFFKTYLNKEELKGKEEHWARWFYGFSLLLGGNFNAAYLEFTPLVSTSKDLIITGISAYFLSNSIAKYCETPVECLSYAENGRLRVIKAAKNAEAWKKEVSRMSGDIHIAIIKKYIDEAGNYIFSDRTEKTNESQFQ